MSTIHLDKLLNPQSIAVVGASDRKGAPGHAIATSLLAGKFSGTLSFVNPRYKTVLGQTSYRSLKKIEPAPDLVVVLVPERIIRRTLLQIAACGCKVAIIMSAMQDSKAAHKLAQKLGIRMLGPFCAGIIRPHLNLNATYSNNSIAAGSLALVTQSASLGAAIIDWAEPMGVGFSAVLSTGSDTDVTLPDLLDLLAEDHHTKAIIVYLDRVRHTRSFLSAISAAARIKPVVLMKSTQDGARYCDALTRTGQIYSTEAVFQTAMRRAGVVRVHTFSNLFSAARILTSGLRVKGKRLAIISNGAAPGMLACERMATKDFELPSLSEFALSQLSKHIHGPWSGQNPIVLRDDEHLNEQYNQVLSALHENNEIDALLVLFAPDARNDPEKIAHTIIEKRPKHIPVVSSFMGEASVVSSRELLGKADIPCFRTPEAATDAVDFLYRHLLSQQELLQLPNPTSRYTRADASSAKTLISQALEQGERVLGPQKTRTLLGLFDIRVLPAIRVTNLEDAVESANKLGYPIAMKLVSPNVRYKAEVLGTVLNVQNETELLEAYNNISEQMATRRPDAQFRGVLIETMHTEKNTRNLSMSITRDASFGPVINVGIGGDLSALVQERVSQLPPLNNFLIDSMLATPTLTTYLGEFRHQKPVSTKGAAHVLRRLSEMACELPDVFSVDINPVRVSPDGAVAIDAQVVLEQSKSSKEYGHLAIHPYPWRWVRLEKLKGDRTVQLRPIRPEDGESIRKMVHDMSAESRYFRFMHAINDLSPQLVAQFTKLDYDRQMAFVAIGKVGEGNVVGVSRYTMSSDQRSAEFAVSIADDWQGYGLASALMRLVIEHAKAQGLEELVGDVLTTNTPMRGLMKSLGFTATSDPEDRELLIFSLSLQDS